MALSAEELQLGDWVISDGEPHKVCVLRRFPEGHTIGCHGKYGEFFDNINKITPIPLTPEILAKNGFERRGGISYHKSIAGLIIHHWNDELCFLNYSKKNIPPIMIPFHYVHELQRALRCCKLDDLADNFKVE